MLLRITAVLTALYSSCFIFWLPENPDFFFWRRQLIIYAGFLGLAFMTLTMLLALRPLWLEKRIGGLDKMYRLHKHTGIASAITIGLHWLMVKMGPWAVSWGLVESARRGRGGSGSGFNLRSFALDTGNWSLYLMLFLVAASLIRLVTYKRFAQIHKLGGIIFILAAIHSVLLIPSSGQYMWVGLATWAFSIAGCIFALISLTGNIGKNNRVSGMVNHISRPTSDLVLFQTKLDKAVDYQPGQFAYIDFRDGEKPHPFTLIDYNRQTQTAEFAIKALGDYTTDLVDILQEQQAVFVEGPYGQFLYSDHKQQVWIGAGIGIVPFIAMAESLVREELPLARKIKLYYRVHALQDAVFHSRLVELSEQIPGFEVVLLASDQGGSLDADDIAREVPLNEYQVCFCGPASFGETLEAELIDRGLPKTAFKKEFFEFR